MPRSQRSGVFMAALAALALLAVACSDDDSVSTAATISSAPAPPASAPRSTSAPTPPETPGPPTTERATLQPSADGRYLPLAADGGSLLAEQIVATEAALRDPDTPPEALPDLGHQQQVIYRHLGRHPEWDADVLAAVPAELRPIVELQLAGRRAFYGISSGYGEQLPAWRIVEPEPAENLLSYYQEAEADYGIEWEYLAAINLVETGMGRIYGFSTAGAQGPMQFIPATWADYGQGDINNPRDAIRAAARYLRSRGGPDDMDRALYGYNPTEYYVDGVSRYAEIMQRDPAAFLGFYHWEIHFSSYLGDLWLPVGYEHEEPILITDYLTLHPESNPPPNGWVPVPEDADE
ncbi:MAG: transglycosylase SLT domain-containing protein [Acidimicrobiales bacterium]|nr:transglycosylase SLT domain-containing protein [Acidimicrobiales bacterium]